MNVRPEKDLPHCSLMLLLSQQPELLLLDVHSILFKSQETSLML